jgi:heme/copper-type cytochrome/quinol oxidase subunit 2
VDELILGFVVGSVVAVCFGIALTMWEQSRERKKRYPNSKMTGKERWIIILALISIVIVVVAGVGVLGGFLIV